MKSIKTALLLLALCSVFATCKKDDTSGDKLYFKCKVNGQDYIPGHCANCLKAQILGDTVFLFNANAGFETVGFGVIKLDHIPILNGSYILNDNPQQSGDYDNSPQVDDIFKTTSIYKGQINVIAIDKIKKLIECTFYFDAYNPVKNATVHINEGAFRLNYSDY